MPAEQKNASENFIWSVFLFAVLILNDQLIKNLTGNPFKNSNFAFSLPLPTWLIYLIYAAVISGLIIYFFKNQKYLKPTGRLAFTLIFAGAASNIAERLFLGYVKDFVYINFYKWTGVYNLADFYIIIGILLLILINETNKNLKI